MKEPAHINATIEMMNPYLILILFPIQIDQLIDKNSVLWNIKDQVRGQLLQVLLLINQKSIPYSFSIFMTLSCGSGEVLP